jgi:hypothetical protein
MTWRDDERDDSRQPDPAPSPGASPRTTPLGYQSASEEPATSAQVSGPPSQRELKERVKRQREPGVWLPGADELDREAPISEDRETRFSGDSYGGRGNPQVSVRLRPRNFKRLRRAADLYGVRPTTLARMMVIRGVGAILDAELRRSGEFLREGPL